MNAPKCRVHLESFTDSRTKSHMKTTATLFSILLNAGNRLSCALLVAALLALPARAATVIWNGPATTNTANNWSTDVNWLGGTPPTSSDDAKFFDVGAIPGVTNVNNTVDGSTNIAS